MQAIASACVEWTLCRLSSAKPIKLVIEPEIGQMRYRPVRGTV